jgi:polyisoprenoid-binding protein YceI
MATTQAPASSTVWKIDPTHSHIEFAVKHLMISTVKGRFDDVEGTITIAANDPSKSSVQRDDHLRSSDFLHAESFPDLTFASTRITGDTDDFKVTGQLTIRGVTREITLDATEEGSGKDPWGGERIGFSSKTKLDRRDYGLVWNQAIETGGVVVGNDVKISIEIEAVKQG